MYKLLTGLIISTCNIIILKFYFQDQVISKSLETYNKKYNTNIESLKPLQTDSLKKLINGSDVLAILPTGYGKSLLYEITPITYSQMEYRDIFVLILVPLNIILTQQTNKLGKEAGVLKSPVPRDVYDKLVKGEVTHLFLIQKT